MSVKDSITLEKSFQMNKRFDRKDFVFIGVLLLVFVVIFVFCSRMKKAGSMVIVEKNGKTYCSTSLYEDQRIEIEDDNGNITNILIIEDKKAYMQEADCPDQLCVHQKAISKTGETIVCLPNRVVVSISSHEKDSLDGIAQ